MYSKVLFQYNVVKGINNTVYTPEGAPTEAGNISASTLLLSIDRPARMQDRKQKNLCAKQVANQGLFYQRSVQVFVWVLWPLDGINSKRTHIFHNYFRTQLKPSTNEWSFEITNTVTTCINLFKLQEKEQVGGEFTEKNFTGGKRKNWPKNVKGISERGFYIRNWYCFIRNGCERVTKELCVRGELETEQRLQHIDPQIPPSLAALLFSFCWAAQPGTLRA